MTISNDDYLASAKRDGESGIVHFRLLVGADGRVTNCTISRTSGSPALDNRTCRLMRARFTPALDLSGNPVPDQVESSIGCDMSGA